MTCHPDVIRDADRHPISKSASHECVDGSLIAEQSRQEVSVTFRLILSKFATASTLAALRWMEAI